MALVNSKQSQRDDIIKYIGVLGQAFTCPACARRIKKGLLRHKDGVMACSPVCLNEILAAGAEE